MLVDGENSALSPTMLGTRVDIPFHVTATALGKLGNPEGEVVLTRGAKKHNVIQMIPTLSSCSIDKLVDAKDGSSMSVRIATSPSASFNMRKSVAARVC